MFHTTIANPTVEFLTVFVHVHPQSSPLSAGDPPPEVSIELVTADRPESSPAQILIGVSSCGPCYKPGRYMPTVCNGLCVRLDGHIRVVS